MFPSPAPLFRKTSLRAGFLLSGTTGYSLNVVRLFAPFNALFQQRITIEKLIQAHIKLLI